ncbi:hypothetical protein SDC9_87952 [bioreactor metagenome]|uniref:Uncharacterized protein n=1 Tax=bioreactor metagenome TaxID=1076179 RepID=A0A644ZK98_9ZZZZ
MLWEIKNDRRIDGTEFFKIPSDFFYARDIELPAVVKFTISVDIDFYFIEHTVIIGIRPQIIHIFLVVVVIIDFQPCFVAVFDMQPSLRGVEIKCVGDGGLHQYLVAFVVGAAIGAANHGKFKFLFGRRRSDDALPPFNIGAFAVAGLIQIILVPGH